MVLLSSGKGNISEFNETLLEVLIDKIDSSIERFIPPQRRGGNKLTTVYSGFNVKFTGSSSGVGSV